MGFKQKPQLVGGLEPWNFMALHILGMSSSQLTFIFFRGVQTTNQNNVKFYWLYCMLYSYLFGIREVLKTLDPQDHPNSSPGKCRESHDLQGGISRIWPSDPLSWLHNKDYPLVSSCY
jgi:hypothetical protein